MKMTLKFSLGRQPFQLRKCVKLSHYSSNSKLRSYEEDLKNDFRMKTLNILSNKSKGTCLRLIHAKFDKDPMRNGRVI